MNHIGVCKTHIFCYLMCGVKFVVLNEVYIVHCTGADAGSGSGLGVVQNVLCAVCSVVVVTGKCYPNFSLTGSAISPLFFEMVSNKITKLGSIWNIQQVAFTGQKSKGTRAL